MDTLKKLITDLHANSTVIYSIVMKCQGVQKIIHYTGGALSGFWCFALK